MKKLVLLFAAVFAMTFVSCDQKGTESASKSSDSIESVSSKSGESISEASPSGEATQSDATTSENKEEGK